jgi:hypothetical protein
MDSEIFFNWFEHHFLVHTPSLRPLLLLLDGHSTHYNPGFIRRAAEEKIIVFCFPPNTTHLTQPLDKGIFGPLKSHWNEECQRFMSNHPGRIITEYDFMPLFSKAWYKAMSITNILSAFRTTGVHPFNRNSIRVVDNTPDSHSLAERTGLAFIPLYSPAARPKQSLTGHSVHKPISFSNDEVVRFTRRYEEGYDLTNDERYNLWLQQYCNGSASNLSHVLPEVDSCVTSNLLIGDASKYPRSTLRKVLVYPDRHVSSDVTVSKSARVLTSLENQTAALEEKERKKNEKEELKLKRKLDRERKKLEKQATSKKKKSVQDVSKEIGSLYSDDEYESNLQSMTVLVIISFILAVVKDDEVVSDYLDEYGLTSLNEDTSISS